MLEDEGRWIAGRYGEFVVPPGQDLIGDSLRRYGEWAQTELDVLAAFISAGQVVVDVGSFIGTHARAFSSMVGPEGRVYAFEPNQRTFLLLQANAGKAAYPNIIPTAAGLGRFCGTARLTTGDIAGNLGATTLNMEGDADGDGIRILTLDDAGITEPVHFIKIDVEGAELQVLLGASRTIRQFAPVLFLEVNSLEKSHELPAWAREHGYKCFGLVSPAFNPANFNAAHENIFGRAQECGLVLVPLNALDRHAQAIEEFRLPQIDTSDDIALLLLHKPQYPYEVLSKGAAAARLDLLYPWPVPFEPELLDAARRTRADEAATSAAQAAERELAAPERVEASQAAISELQQEISALRESGDDLLARFQSLSHRAQRLEQALAESDAHLQAVVSSTAWRATGPIRRVADRVRPRSDAVARRAVAGATPATPSRAVAVILPVYRDIELTRACIASAMRGILEVPDATLVILNDRSPETGMGAALDQVVAEFGSARVRLETNATNLGFVKTVNKGLALTGGCDVVLLNSDVILPPHWLHRLREEAYSAANVGTVTPLSNNTTICTFPEFLQDNRLPFDMPVERIDAVFAQPRLPNIESPTGIGFCMFIRRDCLDVVGVLNEESFARGYGEENDFCQRALQKGWVNLITPNLFAFHKGGVSFGEEKALLIKNAMRTLEALHPRYHQDVQTFILADPMKQARLLRLIQLVAGHDVPKILHVSHGFGGGTDQHIQELAEEAYATNRAFSLVLSPTSSEGRYRLSFGHSKTADVVLLFMPQQAELLLGLLRTLGVSLVHYHHTIKLHPRLLALSSELGVPYYLTVHDYHLLGGNPTLTDEHGVFSDDDLDCASNPLYPLPAGETLRAWRERHGAFITGALRVIFPSVAAKDTFTRIYPVERAVAAFHLEPNRDLRRQQLRPLAGGKPLVVGILGALSKEKGADYLERIAAAAKEARLPLTFTLVGYAYRTLQGVRTTGPYEQGEILQVIAREQCDLLLYPALWPETYSYTLSYGLQTGLPIIAPRLGAFHERLAGLKNVMLFEHGTTPDQLLQEITAFVARVRSGTDPGAPEWGGERAQQDFYLERYLVELERTVVPADAGVEADREYYVRTLLNNGVAAPEHWPNAVFRTLSRLYQVPGVRRLKQALPPGVKSWAKRFVGRRMQQRP